MSSQLIHFLRPTFYALIAFGVLVGVANLYWAVADPAPDLGVAGLDPQDLIGVDLSGIVFPNPKLPPEEVVRLQLAGLGDAKADGVGILQCFCLASPGNRVVTGPLERFGQMVRTEPYHCMTRPRAVLIGRQWHFYASELPPAPTGQTYQLWAATRAPARSSAARRSR